MADVRTYTCIKRTKLHFPLLNFSEGLTVGEHVTLDIKWQHISQRGVF